MFSNCGNRTVVTEFGDLVRLMVYCSIIAGNMVFDFIKIMALIFQCHKSPPKSSITRQVHTFLLDQAKITEVIFLLQQKNPIIKKFL